MNALKELVDKQNKELQEAVPNPITQSTIRRLIIMCLFADLSSKEMSLLIKFLIESLETSEQLTNDILS